MRLYHSFLDDALVGDGVFHGVYPSQQVVHQRSGVAEAHQHIRGRPQGSRRFRRRFLGDPLLHTPDHVW